MSEPQDKAQTDERATEAAGDKLVLNSPAEAKTLRDFVLWAGLLMLAVLVVFSPAMQGKFIWDDDRHVEKNAALWSADGLEKIWFAPGTRSPIAGTVYPPQYYPMTHTTYWLEYQIASMFGAAGPTIFHVTNLVLHGIGAILLWFVLRRLGVPGAWVAAAIWAIHPLQAESAAWISERKNVLAGVFFFGSILTYLAAFRVRPDGGKEPAKFPWDLWALALVLFAFAMLSKTIACSMPAVVLLLIWWKRGRVAGWHWLALAPFFAIGIALAGLTSHLERTFVGATGPEWGWTAGQRVLIAGRAIWFYVWKNFVPYPLSFMYPKWNLNEAWEWVCPAAVIVVLVILFGLRKWIGRGPIVAALIFCGVLVPALGFVNVFPMRYSFVADHFQYLAGPALIALVVGTIAWLIGRRGQTDSEPRPLPYALSAIVILVLSGLAFGRAQVFTGMLPLWSDVVAKDPGLPIAHYNLGTALLEDSQNPAEHDQAESERMLNEAAQQFATTVQLQPDHDKAYNMWGRTLLLQGKPDQAIEKFHAALRVNPKNVQAMINLAEIRMQKKDFAGAEQILRQALPAAEKDPNLGRTNIASIHQLLGDVLLQMNQKDSALAEYAQAVEMNPNLSSARFSYAKLLREKGNLPEAALQFKKAFELDPHNVQALVDLADLQTDVKNFRPARDNLELAAKLDPHTPGLREAVEKWHAAVVAATRPSTTQSTTRPSTRATTQRR